MVSSAKTPYNSAQGYAMSSCMESIDNTLTKSFEAEKLHHTIITKATTVPTIPLKKKQKTTTLINFTKD